VIGERVQVTQPNHRQQQKARGIENRPSRLERLALRLNEDSGRMVISDFTLRQMAARAFDRISFITESRKNHCDVSRLASRSRVRPKIELGAVFQFLNVIRFLDHSIHPDLGPAKVASRDPSHRTSCPTP
jgi:hypothetical protein